MITWMQRHKKWLIITIWISTIAFVGAGFVGWGEYSYGDKAGAVAKVGDIEITQGELQKSYSHLYAQYSQMFKGNFDAEKAKQFGLQKQALQQLVQQSLILNLAASYDLEVSDAELIQAIQSQKYFFKDGVFDKESYKTILSQNRMSTKEYEAGLKKDLLIQKTLKLLPVEASATEENILNTVINIADKINYKILTQDQITLDTSDAVLKPYWKSKSQNFMTAVSYDVKYIEQKNITKEYDKATLSKYYTENKTHFKDAKGKIISLESATEAITQELNAKATKDKALRTYIAYKKGKLDKTVPFESTTISSQNNPFDAQTLKQISQLSQTSPYMKPILIKGTYYTFELVKTNPSVMKSYEEAKSDVLALYTTEMKKVKLQELANNTLKTFSGTTTDFLTIQDSAKFTALNTQDATEFLQKLFTSNKKRSYIALNSGKIILYTILEQKLLDNSNNEMKSTVVKLKTSIFNEALIKTLENKYQTEIYIQGL